jgi:hypothetical protein
MVSMTDNDDDEPKSETGQNGDGSRVIIRDEHGRIVKGSGAINPKGRPKGAGARPVLSSIAERMALAQGVSVPEALQSVLESMFRQALAGDVQAGKLLLERLSTDDETRVLGFEDGAAAGPPIPAGADLIGYLHESAATWRAWQPDDPHCEAVGDMFEAGAAMLTRCRAADAASQGESL